jgi:hypothetical protein
MWTFIGIVVVVVLIGAFVLISPGAPARDFRNKKDAQAGWRGGGHVSWFHDDERRD